MGGGTVTARLAWAAALALAVPAAMQDRPNGLSLLVGLLVLAAVAATPREAV